MGDKVKLLNRFITYQLCLLRFDSLLMDTVRVFRAWATFRLTTKVDVRKRDFAGSSI